MSAATLSVVVPVYREPLELPRLLAYLATCPRIEECEIIVVDGDRGSSICPTKILPLRIVSSRPGRGRQLNAGAKHATAPMILFLHVDTRPPRRFVSHIERTLEEHSVGAFDLSIRSRNPVIRLISAAGMVRSRLTRIPYGDQAHFFRREAFFEIGAYPTIPLMEDVVIMDRMKLAQSPVGFVGSPAITSDRRWKRRGAIRTTLRNWRLMLAFRSGTPPSRLKHRYPPHAAIETDREAIIVFYRALRSDGVKTRLARGIGARRAVEVYEACVRDLQTTLAQVGARVLPFIDEPAAGRDLFAEPSVPRKLHSHLLPGAGGTPQIGDSLWERMDDAFRRCFAAGVERAVLVGSDIPLLRHGMLRDSLTQLRRHGCVLGPTCDGGFYLIGFRRETYRSDILFAGASADEAGVADATLRALANAGTSTAIAPKLHDLDTVADLELLSRDDIRLGRYMKRTMRRHSRP